MKKVSPEEFVRIWQTANSLNDVVKHLDGKRDAIRNRAARYRKLGIPLKSFKDRLNGVAISELAALANSLVTHQ